MVLQEVGKAMRNGHRGRSAKELQNYYDGSYSTSDEGDALETANSYAAPSRRLLYRFGTRYAASVEGRYMVRFMTKRAGDILASISPENLCEVGSGHGRNLLYLANRMPGVPCTGIELTAAGVTTAKKFQNLDLVETGYGRVYGLTSNGMNNVRQTKFIQGSAMQLPAETNAFDVVTTFAALEQMQLGVDQALTEIRRVAKRYVLLYEPFADANDVLQRLYLWSRNYFRMRIDALHAFGLDPVQVWTGVPVKPSFGYAFVLCRCV
jgi:SAM-dependent methyltransferase